MLGPEGPLQAGKILSNKIQLKTDVYNWVMNILLGYLGKLLPHFTVPTPPVCPYLFGV